MPMRMKGTNIEVPAPTDKSACGGYTGFNSLNPHEIFVCRRAPARRSQIAHGFGKPVIQRMPNGDLVASQYKNLRSQRNPAYPNADEEAALCFSRDEGLTWSAPRLLGLPGRATQLSVLKDAVMVLAAGSKLYWSDDAGESFHECDVKWDKFSRDKRPGVSRGFGETNGVLELPDGTLLATCCTVRGPVERYDDFQCYAIRSRDRGRTWEDGNLIIETDEVELLRLRDGRLLGFARLDTSYSRDVWGQGGQTGEGGDQMALIASSDEGRTWTKPSPIGLGMAQIPGFPLELPDGRIVLIYGNRQFPFGCQAIGTRDHGKTWDLENFLMLAYASWDNYGGHPRSILMPDGSVMTGYYARYFRETPTVNEDIVSHCLRWNVPEDWPPERA
ncbi:MAG: hypothetical protein V2A58_04065 [Planctomycetota bacterium]